MIGFKRGALLCALLLALTEPALAAPIEVEAARIPLYSNQPDERRAGALIYRGGLELKSTDRGFGGWSDLAVSADGSDILAISDEAHWLRAHLSYDASGDLAGMNVAEIAPMLNEAGRPMIGKEGDAEGLTLERPHDLHGTAIVSFERDVRVWRYDLSKGLDAKPTNVPIGDWVKRLHDNQQLEAITLLNPDTLLAFAEAKVNVADDLLGALEAYPGDGRPHTRMLSVVPHDPSRAKSSPISPCRTPISTTWKASRCARPRTGGPSSTSSRTTITRPCSAPCS
jgi:hypothetical protein